MQRHHSCTEKSFEEKILWWSNNTNCKIIDKNHSQIINRKYGEDILQGLRCGICWLRIYDCNCSNLFMKRASLNEFSSFETNTANYVSSISLSVLIYYHYMEIGRSANTAHAFQAICPDQIPCDGLLYGDFERETILIDEIEKETLNPDFDTQTCFLYPSSTAVSISEWIKNRQRQRTKPMKVRLVVLDGTYPCASRQMRFLKSCCELRNIDIPLVKLDLDQDQGVKSAIAGVMYQPNKEKICSFQATVMAMQQIIETQQSSMDYYNKYQQLFISLSNGLEDWISHILSSKVKQGKAKPKAANKEVDSTPANYIKNIMNKNKESNILKIRRKKKSPSIIIITTKKFSILEIL